MFYIQKDNSGILAWKLQINSVIGSFFIKTNCCFRKRMIRIPSPMARIPQFRFLIRWRLITARTAELDTPVEGNDRYVHMGLRASWDYISRACYEKAGKAYQLLYWDSHSRFCPVCGTPTVQTTSITKQCPSCKHEIYPTISAAMIVLIRKEDSILLVHARNFRGTFHGLVAGFLEVGETLEECVRREVREETGLEVDNITYFGNQPWPYPSGLMVGFVADYVSGEIKLQDEELSSGAFYTKDNLPEIPRKLSLARKLIDWWLDHQ